MPVAAPSLGCLVRGIGFAGLSSRDLVRAAVFGRWSGVRPVLGARLPGAALRGCAEPVGALAGERSGLPPCCPPEPTRRSDIVS